MNYSESNPDKLGLSHLYQGKAVMLKPRVIISTTYQLRIDLGARAEAAKVQPKNV